MHNQNQDADRIAQAIPEEMAGNQQAPVTEVERAASMREALVKERDAGAQPGPALGVREDWQIMASAHALCPTDLPHLQKMRWIASYVSERACRQGDRRPAAQSEQGDLIAALAAMTSERDSLLVALGAPETITAEPAGDYDNLRKQFLSLRMLANSNARMVQQWRDQCGRETRETVLANAANVNAERETNAVLTDALEAAEAELDRLRKEVSRQRHAKTCALEALADADTAEMGATVQIDGLRDDCDQLRAEAKAMRAALKELRNHTSMSLHQIALIDAALSAQGEDDGTR